MSIKTFLQDKLVNVVAGMGGERDKAAHTTYGTPSMSDQQLENAYRGAWLPRKIVDIPAQDATRRWRGWQADKPQIEKIEAEEKRLKVRQKVKQAMIKARLSGGSAIFIGTGEADPSKPLKPETLGPGGIKYLTVLDRKALKAGELETDVLADTYGRPRNYTISGAATAAQVTIHPSRLAIFLGSEVPAEMTSGLVERGWSDSVLMSVMDAITNADSTMANMASLVFEAKVDVFKVPGLLGKLASDKTGTYERSLLQRFSLAALMKGTNGALLMDADELYESKSANFGGLPDVADRFLQAVAGAADIPATRLLGMAPAGMNATGDSDLRNYYDRLQSMQELDLTPALELLDECLIRSALGSRPPEIHYEWKPLWQATATDKATIGKTIADTLKVLKDSRMFPDEALARAAATTVVEYGIVPGLEAAIEEFGDELPDEEADIRADEQAKAAQALAKATGKAPVQTQPAKPPATR
jgi:phage-related protein (TIGR01555 family)